MSSKENNPGNFANRPKEEVLEAARKGGEASHGGGFASMDAEKQVLHIFHSDMAPLNVIDQINAHFHVCVCV